MSMRQSLIKVRPPVRIDQAGNGQFGSPRGLRTHDGIDVVCVEGSEVLAPCDLHINHYGWAYADGPGGAGQEEGFRVITGFTDGVNGSKRLRFFYVRNDIFDDVDFSQGPSMLAAGEVVGYAQNVCARYPNAPMMPHIHVERQTLRDGRWVDVNPDAAVPEWRGA